MVRSPTLVGLAITVGIVGSVIVAAVALQRWADR